MNEQIHGRTLSIDRFPDSKPRQSNSEGCVRSSESGGIAHSNNQGGASMSMASALSLFAPASSRDVANELDLLDMVDENEEYEIVRSFAMRHYAAHRSIHEGARLIVDAAEEHRCGQS